MDPQRHCSELNRSVAGGVDNGGAELTDSQKAWHVFSLLLSIQRPASPAELASMCTLFDATPDSIEFLCSIPCSPLHLTPDRLVTFSSIVYITFAMFIGFANAFASGSPHSKLRTYHRKKRRVQLTAEGLPPLKKKKTLSSFCAEEGNHVVIALPAETRDLDAKECFEDDNNRNMNKDKCGPSCLVSDNKRSGCIIGVANGTLRYGIDSVQSNEEPMPDTIGKKNEAGAVHKIVSKADFMVAENFFNSAEPVEIEKHSTPQLKPLQLTGLLENHIASAETEAYGVTPSKVNAILASCSLNQQTPVPGVDHIPNKSSFRDMLAEAHGKAHVAVGGTNSFKSLDGEETNVPMHSLAALAHKQSFDGKHPATCSPSSKCRNNDAFIPTQQTVNKPMENRVPISPCLENDQINRDVKSISAKRKLSYNQERLLDTKRKIENFKESRQDLNSPSVKEQIEQKELPNFDSFVVEEEEGSGGYGTVYRARRKSDGRKFAVKCPHSNANKQYVLNEVKMLERFGGKNFVIKYEGTFRNGNSDCLVLEHVEHDRPDVLKKEIDFFQLQWYGYSMFKALASLHKQGIVHRDVKPGNFLFSRKLNKGYLIDFNLAMDMNQKYGLADKTNLEHANGSDKAPLTLTKSLPPMKNKKYQNTKPLVFNQESAAEGIKRTLQPKNMKRKDELEKVRPDGGSRNIMKSQGADGSGVTSVKEGTSTRNPLGERLREPLLCQGRRELISYAQGIQEEMQGSNPREAKGPASKRKRIAAPPGKEDRQIMYVTPMPLHSSGLPIRGAGLLKSKGDAKPKREGSCVGTKGFRAPEVLFRSLHQGAKLDVWSAGVSLLYLIIGRTPFNGDPDQNIKEIARLRGSEDLWEVAKLHDRKASFPVELFDVKYLPSVNLRDWCMRNTRRPDFLEAIPASLLDLVDKCLTINPRLRISAEEALRHEFFGPCHEILRKQRDLRQGKMLPSSEQTQACEIVL